VPAAPAAYRVRARNLAVESENKIHDDSVAATFGFAGGLVPGVELFAYASHPFTEAWGLDFVGGGRLSVRFRRPVYDGEDVTVTAAPAEDGSCTVAVEGADGEQRAVGRAWAGSDAIPLRHVYAEHPLPDQLLPIEGALPLGRALRRAGGGGRDSRGRGRPHRDLPPQGLSTGSPAVSVRAIERT
jgi:hypothetical protein